MKKLILTILGVLSIWTSMFAQIATREEDSVSYKFGSRPKKGEMSLMLSIPIKDSSIKMGNLKDMLNLSNAILFKYYCTDRNVFRLGASLSHQGETLKGIIADSSVYNPIIKPHVKDIQQNISAFEMVIKPGFERHVSSKNVFDLYLGTDLLIGYGRINAINNINFTNGNYSNIQVVSNYGIFGLNTFAGVNVFIAKLPLSLGLEYGWSGATTFAQKADVSRQDQQLIGAAPTTTAADYIIQLEKTDLYGIPDKNLYGSLTKSKSSWGTNNSIRLTLNFYFRK